MGKKFKIALMLYMTVMLAGCCAKSGTNDFCLLESPILIADTDYFTDGTAKAILAHNGRGAKLCGWK